MTRWLQRSRRTALLAIALAGIAGLAVADRIRASDHQDTPEVELNPRMDINDVYAFPGATAGRVALVMTTSSPIIGTSARFDPNLLYQIKIDNTNPTSDGVEDQVFQITFDDAATQNITVRGPVAPATAGPKTSLITSGASITGAVNTVLGSATGMQVWAGLRGDPFFIDLEQFFKILPDRRPATGPLSMPLTQTATQFRNPGVDLLGSGPGGLRANALAIVIELPKSSLLASSATGDHFGVWGTISR